MKKFLFLVALATAFTATAQQLVLKKGVVLDSIKVNDSLPESFSLYLPKKFSVAKSWPVIFVFDTEGKGKRVLNLFAPAAEEHGYILAASNDLRDSLAISQNMIISSRMFNTVLALLPIAQNRSYTAGFSSGARLASVVPTFIKNIQGVISCGSPVANTEVLTSRNPFHFIGIVGDKDFNYPDMVALEKILNRLKFPNQLLVFDGGHEWPTTQYLSNAMDYLTLSAMAKGDATLDGNYVNKTYNGNLGAVSNLMALNKPLLADHRLNQMLRIYQAHKSSDSLRATQKALRRSKNYKAHRRSQNAAFFKESLIKDDYDYYLEEDILTYNYNNLGWWTYQMEELQKYRENSNIFEQHMADRLDGYLNALIEDNIDLILSEKLVDEEALNFLWMLKTITAPKEFKNYLKVISHNAKISEYGTALFYLEELLKQGYSDKDQLYALEHTSLFRITPEFNEMVEKYLKEARYDIIEE
ncbi:MAG: alpha/beta hydrolase [Aurantibacter sp.]